MYLPRQVHCCMAACVFGYAMFVCVCVCVFKRVFTDYEAWHPCSPCVMMCVVCLCCVCVCV